MRNEGVATAVKSDFAELHDLVNLFVELLAPFIVGTAIFEWVDGQARKSFGGICSFEHGFTNCEVQRVVLGRSCGAGANEYDHSIVSGKDRVEQGLVPVVKGVDLEAAYDDAVA